MATIPEVEAQRVSRSEIERELRVARAQLASIHETRTWRIGRAIVGPLARIRSAVTGRPLRQPDVASGWRGPTPAENAVDLYLDLLKRTLVRLDLPDPYLPYEPPVGTSVSDDWRQLRSRLPEGIALVRSTPFDRDARMVGKDWPAQAESMVGLRRLDNVQHCVEQVLIDDVPGDLIETGVWRGGVVILMRAVLAAYGDPHRQVWAADSFQGLPRPDLTGYEQDAGDVHWTRAELAVSRRDVEQALARYGLWDDRVRFLEGWFHDTLPDAPVDRLSVLRLDGDMYGSTMVALEHLYPKLSPGGFVLVDDYGAVEGCRQAVDDYRERHGITDSVEAVDWTGVFWRKSEASGA